MNFTHYHLTALFGEVGAVCCSDTRERLAAVRPISDNFRPFNVA